MFNVFLAFQSFFLSLTSPDSSDLFLPAWIPHRVFSVFADLLVQNYDFISVEFCDLWHILIEWCDWKLVLYILAASNELNSYKMCMYVMIQHVLHKAGGTDLFSQQPFWHEIGQLQMLVMTLVRAPFHLALRERGSCYC